METYMNPGPNTFIYFQSEYNIAMEERLWLSRTLKT